MAKNNADPKTKTRVGGTADSQDKQKKNINDNRSQRPPKTYRTRGINRQRRTWNRTVALGAWRTAVRETHVAANPTPRGNFSAVTSGGRGFRNSDPNVVALRPLLRLLVGDSRTTRYQAYWERGICYLRRPINTTATCAGTVHTDALRGDDDKRRPSISSGFIIYVFRIRDCDAFRPTFCARTTCVTSLAREPPIVSRYLVAPKSISVGILLRGDPTSSYLTYVRERIRRIELVTAAIIFADAGT